MQMINMKGAHLSSLQERLWGFWQENQTYHVQCSLFLQGKLENKAFLRALQQMVNQYEILRTTFYQLAGADMPIQAISQSFPASCLFVNIENLKPEHQQELVETYFVHLQAAPFDLGRGFQLRTILFRFSAVAHQLFLGLPSFLADAATLYLFILEWSQYYQIYASGQVPLLDEPLQYVDISAWQEELLTSERIMAQQEFWRKIDLTSITHQRLPFEQGHQGSDRALETEQRAMFEPCTLAFDVEEAVSLKIHQLSHQYKISSSSVFLACWSILLQRLMDQEELVLGVAGDGRVYEELSHALGLFTRYIPVSLRYDPQCNLGQFLYTVDLSLQNSLKEQMYFTWNGMTTKEKAGYFPIVFEYEYWPDSLSTTELSLHLSRCYSCIELFSLKLHLLQIGTNWRIILYYDAQQIAAEQMNRVAAMLNIVLREAVLQPQLPICALNILTSNEKEYLLNNFCGPVEPRGIKLLHQLFEDQVKRSPDQLAVINPQVQLTYQELNRKANQLAFLLRDRGVVANTLVSLCTSRSVQMLVGMLAILKAGGAYVPLDPESPALRLDFQLRDTQTPLLLTESHLLSRLPAWDGQIVCLDTLHKEMSHAPDYDALTVSTLQDLAYIIYTSGSTGVPKGVMIQQKSIINYTLTLCNLLECKPGWQYATVSTLAADLGNTAIFCSIASGGCLHILDYETILSKDAFTHWVSLHPIDVIKIVPSHLITLLSDNELAHNLLPARALILGGEVLPPSLLNQLRYLRATCNVYNHYGPTETTIGVLVNPLGQLDSTEALTSFPEHVPISLGRAIANTDVYILDNWHHLLPVGVAGELYVGGAGIAMGYLHLPEQTATRFIPHPFSQNEGARLYRTGDLARYTAEGQVEFLGRRDSQVKLRGYRVELREIDLLLGEHPNVWDGRAMLREDIPGGPRIVGYIVPRQFPAPTSSELRDFIRERLPEYMVPTSFVSLKVFPLTPNGKIDWRQLPKPEPGQDDRDSLAVAPRSPVEELLLDIWKELLAAPALGIHDNFFQMGGHSLLATQAISRVRAILQVELLITSMFESPTVAELAQQIEQILRGEQNHPVPPLVPVERTADLPLSFAQQRLWFLDQLEPGGIAYLIQNVRRLYNVDVVALGQSLQELVKRHESLRTNFRLRAGQPVQVIHPAGKIFLPLINLRGLSDEKRLQAVEELSAQEARTPFDLARGPLFRAALLRFDAQGYILLSTMHHIISDAWSNQVLERELSILYRDFSSHNPSSLSPLPIQYADFAVWQRQWLQGEILERQLSYWKQQLAGLSPLELPADHPRPPVKTYQGSFLPLSMPSQLLEDLKALSLREGMTLFMTLLAAFHTLLARYTGQADISVGTPIANRSRQELENLIGFFVNTLVLRVNLAGNPSFLEIMQKVRLAALQAYAHQDVPFEQLVDALHTERDMSRSPLFQVMFTMQQVAELEVNRRAEQRKKNDSHGLTAEHRTTKFDLTFIVVTDAQNWYCGVEYNTDLFDSGTIHRLLEHWHILLRHIVVDPRTTLSDLNLLSERERHSLLVEWNSYPSQTAPTYCIHTLFEAQVARIPDAIALQFEDEYLTYDQLNIRANQLACRLQRSGVKREVIVGLMLERSLFLCISLLGILKAGGAYVPLDPSYPTERLAFMLTDTEAPIVVTRHDLVTRLSAQEVQIICLDTEWPAIVEEYTDNLITASDASSLDYVIYTSGSTGTPKGVLINHANVCRLFTSTQSWFHFDENDVWTLFHSYAFDFSVWEMWGALLYGGKLIVVPFEISRSPEAFSSLVYTHNVTVLNQTPSAFFQFMHAEEMLALQSPLNLRWIIFGGEALDPAGLLPWFHRHGEQAPQLVNMYGITEVTVHVTYRRLGMQDAHKAVGSVIGRPIPDLQVYVLDRYLQPVPVGVPGQMYVSGRGLSRGYLKRAELTSERFVAHPFNSQPGERLYQTGDLARFLPDGELEYLGRIDDQVKIRGFRIELGEIEALLAQYVTVQSCVVIVREDTPGDKRLIAYIIPDRDASPSPGELRRFLLEKVPDYMVPASFVFLDTLPLTFNGKLDRKSLPLPSQARPELDELFVAPRTSIEEILAGIWATVLGIEQVGIYDNFFALGGDSIKSIQVLSQARERGVYFSLQQLFRYQMVSTLAQVVTSEEQNSLIPEQSQPFSLISPQDRLLLPPDLEDAYPLAMLQAGMLFHSQYNPDTAIYHDINSYRFHAPFKYRFMRSALQQLVNRHAIMRTAFDLSTFSEAIQLVYTEVDVPLTVGDLRWLSPAEQEKTLIHWFEADKTCPFEMTRAPLVRFSVHLLDEESFQLTLSFHHAVLDGWSVATFFTELFKLYRALMANERFSFESVLTIQFRDFVALERRLLASKDAQQYWREKLHDSTSVLLPRWILPENTAHVPAVWALPVRISQEVALGLQKCARELAVPIKSVLLAAHLRVLSLLSGQVDVITGLVSNGRPETTDGDHILGLFLNTLPLRLRLSGGTWRELVQQTFMHECELLPYRWYPLVEIQKQQGVQSLFETIFNFIHFHIYQEVLAPADKSPDAPQVTGRYSFEETNFTFAAYFSLDPVSSEIRLSLRGKSTELSIEQMKAIAGYYSNALFCLADNPQGRYELQPLLSQKELELLLVHWNATDVPSYRDKCLHGMIEEQVERTPDKIALVFEEAALTYSALNDKANQLSHYLNHLGIGHNTLVGIYMERSLEMIVGLLGILKSGNAYLPLDPAYPSERLIFMIKDSQLSLLVTQSELSDELPASLTSIVCLPLNDAHTLSIRSTDNLPIPTLSEQLAYVIYTSGSTGEPKGTLISHRAVVNFFHSMCHEPGMEENDSILAVTSLSFDIAALELLLPLTRGARVQIVSREVAASGTTLAAQLALQEATIMQATPTTWRMLLNEGWGGSPHLKILCGGEVLPQELAVRLQQKGAGLWNMYGPTETTIWSSVGKVDETDNPVSIGRAINNTQLFILDTHFMPVPPGVIGELYIGGEGLAQGYLHHPDLTAEKFLPTPFSENGGVRIYRTGDLARWLPNGRIECLGRVDRQVKVRGFRIEIGEIEAVLEHHASVQECAVILREDEPGDNQLVAYIVLEEHAATIPAELYQYLKNTLPAYMMPSHFVLLDVLPQTPNGKVDRRALPVPEGQPFVETNAMTGARTPVEEVLLEIWQAVLRLRNGQQIGVDDDFFQLGGHSLLATQLIARIRAMLQIELPLRALFEAPTIAELARRVEQELQDGQRPQAPELLPVERGGQPLPLSFAQQRLWFLDQLDPGSTAYLISNARHLRGQLNRVALEQSLRALVQRHESLRTTFAEREGQPVQIIQPEISMVLPVVELSNLSTQVREQEALRLATQERQQPCDLQRGPLLRVYLLYLEESKQMLLISLHHIISDGWSNEVFYRELTLLYQAFEEGRPSPLAPLLIRYADFALWQRRWLQGTVLEQQVAYWQEQLAGILPLELPTDHPRPPVQTHRGASLALSLPASLADDLLELSRREQVTLFMLLLAAFQVLLARYSGQQDIAVGAPIANRTHKELEGLIGFFANTLVLRTHWQDNPSFRRLLTQVREVALGAYTHQDVPFEHLVEILQPERDLSRSPLFQVMFTLQQQTLSASHPSHDAKPLEMLSLPHTATKFDLTLNVTSSPQGFLCDIEYNSDLFEDVTIQRMLQHWHVLLAALVANDNQPVESLPLLTEDEIRQLLIQWNETSREVSEPGNFSQAIEAQMERTPDSIVSIDEHQHLTYAQLRMQANQLAYVLWASGVGSETLVALLMERGNDFLVAILAVFRAGGAYLPLDPTHPPARVHHLLERSGSSLVLTAEIFAPTLSLALAEVEAAAQPQIVYLEQVREQERSHNLAPSAMLASQLAYVIYTSGSTGEPKGVMVEQEGMLNHLYAKIQALELTAGDVVAQTASQCFDISVWQFLAILLVGGRVQIYQDEVAHDPLQLLKRLERDGVSILEAVPTMLQGMLGKGEEESPSVAAVRWIISTGEALPPEVCRRWLEQYPEVALMNAYGPTECSDDVTHALLTTVPDGRTRSMPIGKPITNMRVYVLDHHFRLVPVGVKGELYVGGVGVGRGYQNEAERTVPVFLPDPFSPEPGKRLYRTGDLARYLPDGSLDYLGRQDQQIKLRGYRIELGEIEEVLRQHSAVRESALLLQQSNTGVLRLVAFVALEQECSVQELRSYLRKRLPEYMVPWNIVKLSHLPTLPNGKIDRKELAGWKEGEERETEEMEWSVVEELVGQIWSAVLGVQVRVRTRSFFELGGHSLLATQVISQVRTVLGVEIGVRALFEAPTVEQFARKIEQAQRDHQGLQIPPLQPVERKGQPLLLSFAQQRLWFLDQLEARNIAYLIAGVRRLQGRMDRVALERSLNALVQRHESLRTTFAMQAGQPVQIIQSASFIALPILELGGLEREDREQQVRRLAVHERQQPCDLQRGPLLRMWLVQLAEYEYVLLTTMHHIISDGWSIEIFYRELAILYRAFVEGKPSPLAPLPIQYADFALWQRQWLQGQVLENQLDYWISQLSGAPLLELPVNHPPLSTPSRQGASYLFTLPTKLSRDLISLSHQENMTLFMTLLAAFQVLLYRYTGQTDIVLGTDSGNRNRTEIEGLIGFFVNILVLRTDLRGKPSFRDALRQVRSMVIGAYAHQETPFDLLVEKLATHRALDLLPLVRALFVMQNVSRREIPAPEEGSSKVSSEMTLHRLEDEGVVNKFDLAVFIQEAAGHIKGTVVYSQDLFEANTIATLLTRFHILLESIVKQPDTSIDLLRFFTDAELKQLEQDEQILRKSLYTQMDEEWFDLSGFDLA